MNPQEHEAHMAKVEEGLNQILQSQDINECHQIAQSLLSEEKNEAQNPPAEEGGKDLRSMLSAAASKGAE